MLLLTSRWVRKQQVLRLVPSATRAVIRFPDSGVCMVSVTLSMILLLTLIVWRLVFAVLQRRPLMREITVPRQRENNFLNRVVVAVITGDRFENGSQAVGPFERKDRAKTYLRRIMALTGATQTGNSYVLDVGTTRFHLRDRYVGRQRDVSDPKCEYEETCFRLPYTDMPRAEQIATALLQLRNNPGLFDRWAEQCGAYKADGQGFTRAQ